MTDFLYAKPSFVGGAATVLDLFGVLQVYNTSETAEDADTIALQNDFMTIREDFMAAYSRTIHERAAV